MARGKLVGNFVDHRVTVRPVRVPARSSLSGSVDETSLVRTLLPGYQRVSPHVHSMDFRSGEIAYSPHADAAIE